MMSVDAVVAQLKQAATGEVPDQQLKLDRCLTCRDHPDPDAPANNETGEWRIAWYPSTAANHSAQGGVAPGSTPLRFQTKFHGGTELVVDTTNKHSCGQSAAPHGETATSTVGQSAVLHAVDNPRGR